MSPQTCCVTSCTSTRNGGVTLHIFPDPRDPMQVERFRVWVMKIGGELLGRDDLYIFKNRRICHNHFEEIFTFPNKRLTKLAVPSLNLTGVFRNYPINLQQPIAKGINLQQAETDTPNDDIQTDASVADASIDSSNNKCHAMIIIDIPGVSDEPQPSQPDEQRNMSNHSNTKQSQNVSQETRVPRKVKRPMTKLEIKLRNEIKSLRNKLCKVEKTKERLKRKLRLVKSTNNNQIDEQSPILLIIS